jgi:hypothetical protein
MLPLSRVVTGNKFHDSTGASMTIPGSPILQSDTHEFSSSMGFATPAPKSAADVPETTPLMDDMQSVSMTPNFAQPELSTSVQVTPLIASSGNFIAPLTTMRAGRNLNLSETPALMNRSVMLPTMTTPVDTPVVQHGTTPVLDKSIEFREPSFTQVPSIQCRVLFL